MKILLVITKAEIGGAQAFVLTLAKGLKARGQEVAVAAGDGDYLPSALQEAGIRFFRLKSLKRSSNPLSVLTSAKELRQLIRREGFSVLHLNSSNALSGTLAAKMSGRRVKTIFTVHGLSVLDKNYQANFIIKFLFKVYFKFFSLFINKTVFVSHYNKEEASKQGIGKNGVVIYNGLAIKQDDFLDRVSARQKISELVGHSFSENDFLIGSIGRLAYPKNYEFIINLWPLIKEKKSQAKLIIIGEGPEREKYQKLIKDNNLMTDIYLPGESKDARSLLKSFDLFVLPSIYEGLSISLIEALFAGVPALASDVGGNREVIGEGSCFALNNHSFIEKFLEDRGMEEIKKDFFAEKMVREYLIIYE